MTSEERFAKIENAIEGLIERPAHQDPQIEKQNAGIRDLAAISSTLIQAQETTNRQLLVLAEAQQQTDARLNALIVTVDRFLKGLQKPNGREGQ